MPKFVNQRKLPIIGHIFSMVDWINPLSRIRRQPKEKQTEPINPDISEAVPSLKKSSPPPKNPKVWCVGIRGKSPQAKRRRKQIQKRKTQRLMRMSEGKR
jgi:hypothetical protein